MHGLTITAIPTHTRRTASSLAGAPWSWTAGEQFSCSAAAIPGTGLYPGVLGIYTDPEHAISYADGEVFPT